MKKFCLIYLIMLLCCAVNAQSGMTNTGNLQVHAGGSITNFGDFSNTSTAALINNGTFAVNGNITNDQAGMSAGTGALHLTGSSLQTISGSQDLKVYNLTTNNTSGFTLSNNLSIASVHTFTSGVIATSATPNYVIYENGASHTGSADNRHVNGWVRRTGSTSFTFPVGNGSYLRSINISSLSASSVFDARHHMVTTNIMNVASPLFMVDANEYWSLNQVSGGTAQVQLNWDNSKVPFPNWLLTSIRVQDLHFTSIIIRRQRYDI